VGQIPQRAVAARVEHRIERSGVDVIQFVGVGERLHGFAVGQESPRRLGLAVRCFAVRIDRRFAAGGRRQRDLGPRVREYVVRSGQFFQPQPRRFAGIAKLAVRGQHHQDFHYCTPRIDVPRKGHTLQSGEPLSECKGEVCEAPGVVTLRIIFMSEHGMSLISAPVSYGELIDKITILEIKSERMTDATKLANVRDELQLLNALWAGDSVSHTDISGERAELKRINEALWGIEDEIRAKERNQAFDARFIELARTVYHANDKRAAVKRAINLKLGSRLVEEKSYQDYGAG